MTQRKSGNRSGTRATTQKEALQEAKDTEERKKPQTTRPEAENEPKITISNQNLRGSGLLKSKAKVKPGRAKLAEPAIEPAKQAASQKAQTGASLDSSLDSPLDLPLDPPLDPNDPLDQLFRGALQGVVVVCYENERPLQGLAGRMDWYFAGAISKSLRNGAITGQPGECAYVPLTRGGRTYHALVIGAGNTPSAGKRIPVPENSLALLRRNLTSLGLKQVGVSRSDFGDVEEQFFVRELKGAAIQVFP